MKMFNNDDNGKQVTCCYFLNCTQNCLLREQN